MTWQRIYGDITTGDLKDSLGASLSHLKLLQQDLAARVSTEDRLRNWDLVGGVDVSNSRFSTQVHAGVVLLGRDLELLNEAAATGEAALPYVPGFLAFRELPVLLAAWEQLPRRPDVVLVDGHGISHPRGLGIASHLGVLLDLPTVGCAKSVLVGSYEEPGPQPGDWSPLVWKGKTLAAVLRTKARTRPIIISPGHAISLSTAIRLVLACGRGYRLPEPTRQAHLAANRARLKYN